jgi:hypothetical protein
MFLATGEGKPLKVEAQGRHSHETRREGLRAEQSVRRSRKPGGAAQPGEANPVLVATRFLKRRRARNPMGGSEQCGVSLAISLRCEQPARVIL